MPRTEVKSKSKDEQTRERAERAAAGKLKRQPKSKEKEATSSKRRRVSRQTAAAPSVPPTSLEVVSSQPPHRPEPVWNDQISQLLLADLTKSDENSVEAALASLHQALASNNDDLQKALLLGGPTLVVLAMRKFPENSPLQLQGCQCLFRFSVPLQGREALSLCGGMQTLLTHDKEEDTLRYALATMRNLLAQFAQWPPSIQTMAHQFVHEWEGPQWTVQTMKRYGANARIQLHGCATLYFLAHQPDAREALITAGTVSVVGSAMERYRDDAEVQLFARAFLEQLFSKNN